MRKGFWFLIAAAVVAGGAYYFYRQQKSGNGSPLLSTVINTVTNEAGALIKKMTAPGAANNNPTNLEFDPKNPWLGQIGSYGKNGRFAKFSDVKYGFRAAGRNLDNGYIGKGINTIAAIVNKWAPKSDNNDVKAYIDFVSKKSGILSFTPITRKDYPKLLQAMAKFEVGVDYPLSTIEQGLSIK